MANKIYLDIDCPEVRKYIEDDPDKVGHVYYDLYTQDFAKAHVRECQTCQAENSRVACKKTVRDNIVRGCKINNFKTEDIEKAEGYLHECLSVAEKLKAFFDEKGILVSVIFYPSHIIDAINEQLYWIRLLKSFIQNPDKIPLIEEEEIEIFNDCKMKRMTENWSKFWDEKRK